MAACRTGTVSVGGPPQAKINPKVLPWFVRHARVASWLAKADVQAIYPGMRSLAGLEGRALEGGNRGQRGAVFGAS